MVGMKRKPESDRAVYQRGANELSTLAGIGMRNPKEQCGRPLPFKGMKGDRREPQVLVALSA
jgi:hypothetical protein